MTPIPSLSCTPQPTNNQKTNKTGFEQTCAKENDKKKDESTGYIQQFSKAVVFYPQACDLTQQWIDLVAIKFNGKTHHLRHTETQLC